MHITVIIGSHTADIGVTSVPIPCVQVTISALNLPFQPNKLARSIEEAKMTAAEYALAQMGFTLDGAICCVGVSGWCGCGCGCGCEGCAPGVSAVHMV